MHSPAPRITLLPSVYQPLPSELQQQPQTATPNQLQQPRGILYIKNAGRSTGCIRNTSDVDEIHGFL